jgi:hypothetical protein
MPDTMPVAEPITATAVLLLLHVPPVDALLSVVLDPRHTLAVPVIAVTGLTLTLVAW